MFILIKYLKNNCFMKNISTNSRGGVTAYLAPEIEVAEITVEAGFAQSLDSPAANYDDYNDLGTI